jgi:hypothetical protein
MTSGNQALGSEPHGDYCSWRLIAGPPGEKSFIFCSKHEQSPATACKFGTSGPQIRISGPARRTYVHADFSSRTYNRAHRSGLPEKQFHHGGAENTEKPWRRVSREREHWNESGLAIIAALAFIDEKCTQDFDITSKESNLPFLIIFNLPPHVLPTGGGNVSN